MKKCYPVSPSDSDAVAGLLQIPVSCKPFQEKKDPPSSSASKILLLLMVERERMAEKKGHHHYGSRRPRSGRNPGDNPHIRHSKQEHEKIALSEDYEVLHAKKVGAIKVGEDGGVQPVPGRTHIEKGELVYDKK